MDVSHIMSVNALLSTANTDAPTSQSPSDKPIGASTLRYQQANEACENGLSAARRQFDEYTSRNQLEFDPVTWKPIVPSFSFNNGFDVTMGQLPGTEHPQQQSALPPAYSLVSPQSNAPATQPHDSNSNRNPEPQVFLDNDEPAYNYFSNTDTAKARSVPPMIYNSGESDVRMSEAPSLPDSHASDPKPAKGRSFGDKSCKAVKIMRASAEAGDIQAAIRLGWGVERITKLWNEMKAARGEEVVEGQPIDDPKIIAQITERQKKNRDHQRERAEKLKALAQSGDLEAAKKAGYGRKRIEELFPELKEPAVVGIKQEDFDFEKDEVLDNKQPVGQKLNDLLSYDLGLNHQQKATENGTQQSFPMGTTILPAPLANNGTGSHIFGGARYPMPGPGYGVQVQLRAHYEEAKRSATIAQGRVIEATQAAELAKQRVVNLRNQLYQALSPNLEPSRKRKKNESIGSKKQQRYKNRPSNFPAPAPLPAHADNNKGSTADEAIELDD